MTTNSNKILRIICIRTLLGIFMFVWIQNNLGKTLQIQVHLKKEAKKTQD